MASCPHVANLNVSPPSPNDSVYREDCTICFDSIDDEAGLDVCLTCFNGGCAGEREHSKLHAKQSQHQLAVNIKRTRKTRERGDSEPLQKINKLAIEAETEADRYTVQTDVRCLACGITGISKGSHVGRIVDGILKANTFAKEEEIKAWEQEMEMCEHTLMLQQEEGKSIPSGDLGQCRQCDLKENLWLCLTCGNLGCGRKNYMNIGPPGNNHQVEHNQATGHPVAVKLGSLTADGTADIHCYACDEERVDPELVAHLANWGIDIADRQKTEKSVTEMQLEHNLTFDFSMHTADGQQLEPLFGEGLTGLKNLGNSCYLNSIVQALFSFKHFQERYHIDGEVSTVDQPARNLEIQLRKLADGLLTDRYSKADKDVTRFETGEETWQKGLAPSMFKHLVGKGHPEFSTMRQQDAYEFLQHLLSLITESHRASKSTADDPVDAFRFILETKLKCLSCEKVRYRFEVTDNISVFVPAKRLPDADTDMTNGENEKTKEQFEAVPLMKCLDIFTDTEKVDLKCSECGGKGFTKRNLFQTFPDILAIHIKRFQYVNWVPTKLDVPIIVGDEVIDFDKYKSRGSLPHEVELPNEEGAADDGRFLPNEAIMQQLMEMGFSKVRATKALHATGNSAFEPAFDWLCAHMDDPDIDKEVVLAEPAKAPGVASDVDSEKIQSLGEMGIAAPIARQALKQTGGNVEAAIEWVFSNPDASGDFGEEESSSASIQKPPSPPTTTTTESLGAPAPPSRADIMDNDPANYHLQSIVCHKGGSVHAGHYVAFIKKSIPPSKEGEWVLFNDEKVAKGGDVDEMKNIKTGNKVEHWLLQTSSRPRSASDLELERQIIEEGYESDDDDDEEEQEDSIDDPDRDYDDVVPYKVSDKEIEEALCKGMKRLRSEGDSTQDENDTEYQGSEDGEIREVRNEMKNDEDEPKRKKSRPSLD